MESYHIFIATFLVGLGIQIVRMLRINEEAKKKILYFWGIAFGILILVDLIILVKYISSII